MVERVIIEWLILSGAFKELILLNYLNSNLAN